MIAGRFDEAGTTTPEELRTAYEQVLIDALEDVDAKAAADEADVDADTITALLDGESPELELTEAAALLGVSEDYPHPESAAAEARDVLLMGMTTAVLDVDALSSRISGEMEPKLIQQKVEGRHSMTLAEYATLHHAIEAETV